MKQYYIYVIPFVVLTGLKVMSYSFYAGLITGVLLTLACQYFYFILYLQEKHKKQLISIDFAIQQFYEIVENGKIRQQGKSKHYINTFQRELEVDYQAVIKKNDLVTSTDEIEKVETKEQLEQVESLRKDEEIIAKVNRKEFLKKIELFQQFNDSIKELENQHGQSLTEFDGLSVIFNKSFDSSTLYLVDQPIDHIIPISEITEQGQQTIGKIIEIQLEKGQLLLLPTWKGFKRMVNMIGRCHVELSKTLTQLISEQTQVLKKEFNQDITDIKKEKKRFLAEYSESLIHLQKIQDQYNALDKDTKFQVALFSEMNKKREDPSVYIEYYQQLLIKQEMKVKLNLSEIDTLKQKLFNAKEKNKDIVAKTVKLNQRIKSSESQWEEQRLVYLKQGLQNQLLSYEDLSQQLQQLVANQIRVVLDEGCKKLLIKVLIHPKGSMGHVLQKPIKQFAQCFAEVQQLETQDLSIWFQRYSEDTLAKLVQLNKYDDDVEYFIRELRNIYERHSHNFEFDSKGYTTLWETNRGTAELIKINVRSIFHGICGLKEIYKEFCIQLEKRRVDISKHKLEGVPVVRELEQCLGRDLKKLQMLVNEDKTLQRYLDGKPEPQQFDEEELKDHKEQKESKEQEQIQSVDTPKLDQAPKKNFYDKQKSLAKHFISEVKSNVKHMSSIGQLVTTVGQSVSRIHKMSNLTKDQLSEQQLSIRKQCQNMFTVLGFTLKNLEDLLHKHQRAIAKEKKNVLLDICSLTDNLNTHFRKTIDESMNSLQQQVSIRIKEAQAKLDQQVVEEAKLLKTPKGSEKVDWSTIQLDAATKGVEIKPQERSADSGKEGKGEIDLKFQQFQNDSSQILSPRSQPTVQVVDKLLKVLVQDWKNSEYFKGKLCKMIHKSLNKKRPALLDEILIKEFAIKCDAVEVNGVHPQQQDEHEWLCDLDLHMKGQVRLVIETKIIINWPRENYARLPVTVNVLISSFNGRLRICFVPRELGKSWISFMGQPVLNLELQPILAQYNITNIPSVSDILREFIIQKVKLLTYPNKCTIPLPMSFSSKGPKQK